MGDHIVPSFTFPARSSEAGDQNDSTSTEASAGHGAVRQREPLPNFKFGSGAAVDSDVAASLRPPVTPPGSAPTSTATTPTRAHRHRRTASALFGGAPVPGTANNLFPPAGPPQTLNTDRVTLSSDTNNDASAAASPDKPAFNPRRGHGHRRSGAVSSQDLSSLGPQLAAAAQASGRPSVPPIDLSKIAQLDVARPDYVAARRTPSPTKQIDDDDTAQRTPRTPGGRSVGFHANLEQVIPRTVSFASTASRSSTMTATGDRDDSVFPGSVDGQATQQSSEPSGPATPSKADPEDLPERPRSAPSPGTDPATGAGSLLPPTSRPSSASDVRRFKLRALHRTEQPLKSSMRRDVTHVDSSSESLGSVLAPVSTTTPESSASSMANLSKDRTDYTRDTSDLQLMEDFDEDPTDTIVDDPPEWRLSLPSPQTSPARGATDSARPKSAGVFDDQSGMIDLDTAIGTSASDSSQFFADFKTSTPRGQNFSTARRSMHSSGYASGLLNAPATNFHRRATSAPLLETPSFRASQDPASSASDRGFAIDKVFEEDEEEDLEDQQQQGSKSKETSTAPSTSSRASMRGGEPNVSEIESTSGPPRQSSAQSNTLTISAPQPPARLSSSNVPSPATTAGTFEYFEAGTSTSGFSSRHASYTGETASSLGTPQLIWNNSPSTNNSRQFARHSAFIETGFTQDANDQQHPPLLSSKSDSVVPRPRTTAGLRHSSLTFSSDPAGNQDDAEEEGGTRRNRRSIASLQGLLTSFNRSDNSMDFQERCATSDGLPSNTSLPLRGSRGPRKVPKWLSRFIKTKDEN